MCNFRLLRVSKLSEHRTKAVFALKLMVGGGEHKEVIDKSGFGAYNFMNVGVNFLCVNKFHSSKF